MANKKQQGITLIELLVVVAIVGIMTALAVPAMTSDPSARDVCEQVANKVREASRKAVAHGPVEENVAAATGITARTRLRIGGLKGQQIAILERLEESGGAGGEATWFELERVSMSGNIELHSYRNEAVLEDGAGPGVPLGGDEIGILCYSNGSCDGTTLYFQGDHKEYRIGVLPLNGSPLVINGW